MSRFDKHIHSGSYLVDYAVQVYGAKITSVQKKMPIVPPFPCLTGVCNTSDRLRIDKDRYPNIFRVLVKERNSIMARKLFNIMNKHPDKKILAVVGAGHAEDMVKIIEGKYGLF